MYIESEFDVILLARIYLKKNRLKIIPQADLIIY